MPDLVSGRALADALGVSETAVRKAAKAGRIPRAAEGKFDLAACREAWLRNTDPARTKVCKSADLGAQSAPGGTHSAVRTPEDARAAVALISAVLRAEGADAARPAEPHPAAEVWRHVFDAPAYAALSAMCWGADLRTA